MTIHWTPPASPVADSLSNLLVGCIGLAQGQTLLIVGEPDNSFYRGNLAALAAEAAVKIGARVTVVRAAPIAGPEHFPSDLKARIAASDHTLFFARAGSAARFLHFPGNGSKVVSYTLDPESFGSPFASLPYAFLQELHDAIVKRITSASEYNITCPNGSDLTGALFPHAEGQVIPFAVKNFPLMIVPPISAARARGRVALTLALLPTSTHVYDDPVLPLATPLIVSVEDGRITGFGGETLQAGRAEAHFDRVGQLFGADPRSFSSWHTGINPGTFFAAPALTDIHRWSNVAFGSPRYTHFHMVGNEPGDICGSLFDATISFDGETIWEQGRLAFLDSAEGRALAARHGVDSGLLSQTLPIGV